MTYPKRTIGLLIAVIAITSGASLADTTKGLELFKARKFAEAEAELAKVCAAEPKDINAHIYLGRARIQQDRASEALPPLKKAVALDERNVEAHYGLGLAYLKMSNYAEAVKAFERALAIDTNHAYAHYHLGLAYNKTDRKDLSFIHLRRFLELAPDAPEAAGVRDFLRNLG